MTRTVDEINEKSPWVKPYLMALEATGDRKLSAASLGVSSSLLSTLRNTDPAFKEAEEIAAASMAVQIAAMANKLMQGELRDYQFFHGSPIWIECKKDHPEAKEFNLENGDVVYQRHYWKPIVDSGLITKALLKRSPEAWGNGTTTVENKHSGEVDLRVAGKTPQQLRRELAVRMGLTIEDLQPSEN